MYRSMRTVGYEYNTVFPDFTPYTLPQCAVACAGKKCGAGPERTSPPLPFLREKALPLKILVEFIAKLHLYVPEYAPEYFPDLRVNVCHFSCFFEGSSGNKSNRLGMSDATTGVSSPVVAFIML